MKLNFENPTLLLISKKSCPACKKNKSNWNKLYQKNKGRLNFTGISLDEKKYVNLTKDYSDFPFKFYFPTSRSFKKEFKAYLTPLTILVGRNKEIIGTWEGILTSEQLKNINSVILNLNKE